MSLLIPYLLFVRKKVFFVSVDTQADTLPDIPHPTQAATRRLTRRPTLDTPGILKDTTLPTPAPTRPLLWILQVYCRMQLALLQYPYVPYSGYSRYTVGYNSTYSSTHTSPTLGTPGIL